MSWIRLPDPDPTTKYFLRFPYSAFSHLLYYLMTAPLFCLQFLCSNCVSFLSAWFHPLILPGFFSILTAFPFSACIHHLILPAFPFVCLYSPYNICVSLILPAFLPLCFPYYVCIFSILPAFLLFCLYSLHICGVSLILSVFPLFFLRSHFSACISSILLAFLPFCLHFLSITAFPLFCLH